MEKIEEQLKSETEKWLSKIEKAIKNLEPESERGKNFLKNINAYISDCKYFMERGDLVRAFEAVIWAWSQYETGKEAGLF